MDSDDCLMHSLSFLPAPEAVATRAVSRRFKDTAASAVRRCAVDPARLQALAVLSNLQRVDIRGGSRLGPAPEALADFLRRLPATVSELGLEDQRLQSLEPLAAAPAALLGRLRTLLLGGNQLLPAEQLFGIMASGQLPALRRLSLRATGLGAAAAASGALEAALAACPALTRLNLADNELGVAGALVLARAAAAGALPRLERLNASTCGVASAAPDLCAALAQQCPALAELALSTNRIDPAAAVGALRALSALPALRSLSLLGNRLKAPGLEALAAALAAGAWPRLDTLLISGNGAPPPAALWPALPPSLRYLDLGVSGLTDETVEPLCAALEAGACEGLESLGLGMNRIADAGAARLAEALRRGPCGQSLRFLDVASNQLGSEGVLRLLELWEAAPRLQRLSVLGGNRLSPVALRALPLSTARAVTSQGVQASIL